MAEYKGWDKFEVVVGHIDGTSHSESVSCENNEVKLAMGKLENNFKFKPPKKVLSSSKLIKLVATGFDLAEFHDFEWRIKEYEQKLLDLKKREEAVVVSEKAVAELQSKAISLSSEVGKARSEFEELDRVLSRSNEKLSSVETLISDASSKYSSLRQNLQKTEDAIAEKKLSLEELTRTVRLFPSEITGFILEGNRSIKWYIAIAFPFALILAVITSTLFGNALDLTQLWRENEGVDIWTVFLTRVPFVLIALALIEACGFVVGRLIFEIVRINRQRLEFSKIGIIAKDVSAASSFYTDLNDEQIFENETALKMDLLREHMKNYHGTEFECKGSAIINAISGVAQKLAGGKNPES